VTFAEQAIPWLKTATLEQSVKFYRETYADPACDNEVLAAIGRGDLFFLLTHLLGRVDLIHPWLYERCREVQAEPNGYLDLWAREHGKSSIITCGLTIQDVLNDPELTVGIFSHTRPIAKAFLTQIKRELESNEKLKTLYPDVLYDRPDKDSPCWSLDNGIVVKRKSNPKEATIEAWGLVDGQPTSKHYTRLIYDDVVTRESVTNPDQMKKTTEAMELSYNLGARGGARRCIGTRYHFNDSYKVLMDRGTFKPRIHAATKDGTVDGEPVLLTREELVEKRRDAGPYTFGCQQLQNPTADETQGFKEDWLRYHDGITREGLNVYLLFDPAGSKNKRSDYTAGWAVGLAPDKNLYVLDIVRDRLSLTQRAALLMRWHRKWKPMRSNGVRYEKYGKDADIEHIESVQKAQNYRFDITEVGGQTPKTDRMKRLVPYFEQGRVFLPRTHFYTDYEGKTSDLVQDFIQQEYKPFPVPVHDDMLDALARLLDPDPDLALVWPEEFEFDRQLEPETFDD
jgi:predicted phage terminase large subunit-like protein